MGSRDSSTASWLSLPIEVCDSMWLQDSPFGGKVKHLGDGPAYGGGAVDRGGLVPVRSVVRAGLRTCPYRGLSCMSAALPRPPVKVRRYAYPPRWRPEGCRYAHHPPLRAGLGA